ncbi:hypothetical protein ES703_70784 [subsurface metagenome]
MERYPSKSSYKELSSSEINNVDSTLVICVLLIDKSLICGISLLS